jgi:hypothetical protein
VVSVRVTRLSIWAAAVAKWYSPHLNKAFPFDVVCVERSASSFHIKCLIKFPVLIPVGIEANPVCLNEAMLNAAHVDMSPGSSIEWHFHDVMKLSPRTFEAPGYDASHLVIYAYLGPLQLDALSESLLAWLKAGARLVTFETHFESGTLDGCEHVAMDTSTAGLLHLYTYEKTSVVI